MGRYSEDIYETGSEAVTNEWRQLHNEELYNLYTVELIFMVIINKRMRWVEHIPRKGKMRKANKNSVRKTQGKRCLVRSRRR